METSEKEKKETNPIEPDAGRAAADLSIIDGELIEDSVDEKSVSTIGGSRNANKEMLSRAPKTKARAPVRQTAVRDYIFLPWIFLTVALLGGLRIAAETGAFVFLKPPLVCLIFATVLIGLFFRANLLRLDGWFSENFSTLKNVANAAVLTALFAASVQIFNSLLPERGLPFWVFAFCFFWTLLNNLFSVFDARKLIQSLGGLFGFAFLVKYLALASLTAPTGASWWQSITENPTQELFTWALDLPRFSGATGYIQFFAVIFYLLGLFLLPASTSNEK